MGLRRGFDGPDAPPLDPSSVAEVPEEIWPSARIVLHPSLQRLALDHPAHAYRYAVRTGAAAMRPEARRTHVVVFRTKQTELDAGAYALLDEIARGATLEEACVRAAPRRDEIAGWFRHWMESGWISKIYFPPSLP